jgi:hypothetical protein
MSAPAPGARSTASTGFSVLALTIWVAPSFGNAEADPVRLQADQDQPGHAGRAQRLQVQEAHRARPDDHGRFADLGLHVLQGADHQAERLQQSRVGQLHVVR